jgi:electron transfer flavoprotein beta subunit
MNSIVCLKQVPDTEARIKIAPDNVGIDESDIQLVVNPFDENAIEAALLLKEQAGQGAVTLISQGEDSAGTALRTGLAMGADNAVLLKDPAFAGSDSLGVARILAAAISTMEYDVILLGKYGVGGDNNQVGPMLAQLLDLPHVGVAVKLEVDGDKAVVHRSVEGALEVVETPLPAVITAEKGLNEPRYASLKGIMMAKRKPIDERDASALGLDTSTVGAAGALLLQTRLELPQPRPEGRIIDGEPVAAAKELVRLLHEEAKVI